MFQAVIGAECWACIDAPLRRGTAQTQGVAPQRPRAGQNRSAPLDEQRACQNSRGSRLGGILGRCTSVNPEIGPPFNAEVMRVITQWKYRPATYAGRAVDSYLDLTVNFHVRR